MIVESYANSLYLGHVCNRYWISGGFFLMVGGSLLGPEDWEHLQGDYGITDVVNVETEHSDAGKLPGEHLCELQVPDDGTPFPPDKVLAACMFVLGKLVKDGPASSSKFYVHCQMGGSRSPAFAYAVMRGCFDMSSSEALAAVRTAKGDEAYGDHPYHKSYLGSVESALAPVLGGR